MSAKPIHAKPSLYAFYFEELKSIALKYGYNLVLHGSMNRDLDLIAVPWQEELKEVLPMIEEFAEHLGGDIMNFPFRADDGKLIEVNPYTTTYHGRMQYVININRGGYIGARYIEDPQYYIDISVIPVV